MKEITFLSRLTFLLFFLFPAFAATLSCSNQDLAPDTGNTTPMLPTAEINSVKRSHIEMMVTINGLGAGETADIFVTSEEVPGNTLFSQVVEGIDNEELFITLPVNLGDGHYLLSIETSDNYYRDPKGYYFNVTNGKIVNPRQFHIIFNLGPRSDMLEPINDLSAPPKQPPPSRR